MLGENSRKGVENSGSLKDTKIRKQKATHPSLKAYIHFQNKQGLGEGGRRKPRIKSKGKKVEVYAEEVVQVQWLRRRK